MTGPEVRRPRGSHPGFQPDGGCPRLPPACPASGSCGGGTLASHDERDRGEGPGGTRGVLPRYASLQPRRPVGRDRCFHRRLGEDRDPERGNGGSDGRSPRLPVRYAVLSMASSVLTSWPTEETSGTSGPNSARTFPRPRREKTSTTCTKIPCSPQSYPLAAGQCARQPKVDFIGIKALQVDRHAVYALDGRQPSSRKLLIPCPDYNVDSRAPSWP